MRMLAPSAMTTMAATLAAALLAFAAPVRAELPEPVARALQAGGVPQDAIGAVVLRGNTVLVAHNAERSMQPASIMKLVTTAAGLEQLGPVFRGRTELRATGEVADGVLLGDLYLRGGADADFDEDALVHMLERLRIQGIHRIAGSLVLDRQLFQPARSDIGVPPFDESPDAYYNVIPDALLLNRNMLRIDMSSSATQLKAQMLPALEGVRVESAMRLIDADCAKWEDGWKLPSYERRGDSIVLTLRGTFPRHCTRHNMVNVLERNDFVERLFRSSWTRLGGSFTGATREATLDAPMPPSARLLAEHASRPLADVLRDINKSSDNVLARTLFLSLGSLEADAVFGSKPLAPAADQFAANGVPGTVAAASPLPAQPTTSQRADQAIRARLRSLGIDDSGLVLDNGSGLSRSERLKPMQLAALLQATQKSLWLPEFLSSLPIAGVDGTMRRRLKDTPAAARARIKTGALRNVVAIAGYVPDANGELCVVVAMVNHDQAGNGRKALDALMEWVARPAVATP